MRSRSACACKSSSTRWASSRCPTSARRDTSVRNGYGRSVRADLTPAEEHAQVLERGEHLFAQLEMRDVPTDTGSLAIEIDVRPELSNTRGALQGGLVATLIDVVAGRLAQDSVA